MAMWSNPKLVNSRNYVAGLMCHYLFRDGSAQYVFLDPTDEQVAVVNQSLSFCSETNSHLCASCNGLLLFSTVRENLLHYNVFNLFTKQCVALPQPQITRRSIRNALAFDGHRYQVVRVFSIKDVEGSSGESSSAAAAAAAAAWAGDLLGMEIFSSETGMWRQFLPLIRLPTELPKQSTAPLFSSSGAIYWEFGGYLLIYHVDQGHCQLVKLPNHPLDWSWHSMTFGQCLWESGGHVHYCYSDFQGIHIWILLIEQELDNNPYYHHQGVEGHKMRWELAHSIMGETLMSLNPEIFLRIQQREGFSPWKPYFVAPCAYNHDLKTLYLRLPGVIVSYSLRTQSVKEVCTFAFQGINFYCCLVYPVVHGLFGQYQVESDKAGGPGVGDAVSLPVPDALRRSTCPNGS